MNKSLVRKTDYDLYTMPLPLHTLRYRKRALFVRRELEKRHPQFSEKCCTDTRLSFRNGKLTAEVAVMDTFRLAEYKKNFPGKVLFLEERPDRAVFSHNRHLPLKIAVIVVVALFFVGAIALPHHQTDAVTLVPERVETVAAVALLSPEKLLATILSAVGKSGGKVTSLVWQGATCQFSLRGCHPEEISSEKNSTVSYTNGEPHFELSLPVALGNHLAEGGSADFLVTLRRVLLERGLVILAEQSGEKDVSVHIFADYAMIADALKLCAEQSQTHAWHERALTMRQSETGCDIKVSFSAGAQHFDELSPFQAVAPYASLFVPVREPLQVRSRAVTAEHLVPVRDRIGEIKRLDGAVFTYYRQADGKIVCEKAQ